MSTTSNKSSTPRRSGVPKTAVIDGKMHYHLNLVMDMLGLLGSPTVGVILNQLGLKPIYVDGRHPYYEKEAVMAAMEVRSARQAKKKAEKEERAIQSQARKDAAAQTITAAASPRKTRKTRKSQSVPGSETRADGRAARGELRQINRLVRGLIEDVRELTKKVDAVYDVWYPASAVPVEEPVEGSSLTDVPQQVG